jgi:hypothetical protein
MVSKSDQKSVPHLRVGDRVRFLFGPHPVVADVVEDHGGIGRGGVQLVSVMLEGWDLIDGTIVPANEIEEVISRSIN